MPTLEAEGLRTVPSAGVWLARLAGNKWRVTLSASGSDLVSVLVLASRTDLTQHWSVGGSPGGKQ